MSLDAGTLSWAVLASVGPASILVGLALRAQAGRPWLWPVVAALAACYLAVGWRLRTSVRQFLRQAEGERA